jgi:5-carboxymethyl-2-hydroxymuconate isomerase
MPHFIIDCSENVVRIKSADDIMKEVFDAASSTGLFTASEIKVRINPFAFYNNGDTLDDFIHVFGYILWMILSMFLAILWKAETTIKKQIYLK